MELKDDEVVSVNGRFCRFGELAPLLDAQLLSVAQEFAGFNATMQAVVDAYLELAERARRRASVFHAA